MIDTHVFIKQFSFVQGFSFDNKTICVSWEFNATEDGRGNWTEFGCNLTYIDEENETFTCECDHLTNFAILVVSPQINTLLNLISLIAIIVYTSY